jgi:hypothetical protein
MGIESTPLLQAREPRREARWGGWEHRAPVWLLEPGAPRRRALVQDLRNGYEGTQEVLRRPASSVSRQA